MLVELVICPTLFLDDPRLDTPHLTADKMIQFPTYANTENKSIYMVCSENNNSDSKRHYREIICIYYTSQPGRYLGPISKNRIIVSVNVRRCVLGHGLTKV